MSHEAGAARRHILDWRDDALVSCGRMAEREVKVLVYDLGRVIDQECILHRFGGRRRELAPVIADWSALGPAREVARLLGELTILRTVLSGNRAHPGFAELVAPDGLAAAAERDLGRAPGFAQLDRVARELMQGKGTLLQPDRGSVLAGCCAHVKDCASIALAAAAEEHLEHTV